MSIYRESLIVRHFMPFMRGVALMSLLLTMLVTLQPAYSQSVIEGQLQAIAENPVQKTIAVVIEDICPSTQIQSTDLQSRCNEVVGSGLSTETANQAASRSGMQGMAPEQNSVVKGTQIDTSVTQFSNIGARLAALREVSAAAPAQRLTFRIDGDMLRDHPQWATQDYGSSGGSAGDDINPSRWGVFISANGSTGDRDATSRASGFDFDGYGITAGVDYRLTDDVILGVAGGYENTDATIKQNGGNLDSDTYSVSLYGTYYPTQAVYVDGLVGFGRSDIDQNRRINYSIAGETAGTTTTVDQNATSNTDGDQFFATLSTGYDFYRQGFTFGPNVRLQFRQIDVDGYKESMSNPTAAGNGLGMEVDGQTVISLTSVLGMQASYALSTSWGVLVPQGRAEWVHEFRNDPAVITAQFLGGPTAPTTGDNTFRLSTDDPVRDYANIGAGVSAVFARGMSGYLVYQTLVGYSGLTSHGFGGGFRMEF
jgi:outer membrane autotransporter protein